MRLLILVLILVISWGCRDAAKPEAQKAVVAKPRAAVKLAVLVVDDAELAKGITLLAGEWSERSGGELAVAQMTLDELLAANKLSADVVIYPSRYLGTLVMRNWLRPVRESVLEDPVLAWGDFFTMVRDQAVRYGGEVFALSLGEMPLTMAWRGEVPEKLPESWEQLSTNAARTAKSEELPFPLISEFLARTLAATPPADRAALFFDAQTMNAKLDQPQMVRGLEAMAKAASEAKFFAAVAMPRMASSLWLSPLLIGEEVYNASLDRWESSAVTLPPVICGFGGRLVSVTTESRNAASAFKLLPWLVSGSTGSQLSQRSKATLWFRASQVSQGARWFTEAADDNRVSWLSAAMSRGDAYLLPRIPGIDEYLTELEAALGKAISDDQTAAEALNGAAERWNEITDKLGRDEQRMAFNRHLGLIE
ncbi:MAG: hypothetical protein SH868_09525 [Bythopirellula sp.]|nr:hypothetical protein [Bythopirellula sp.]